MGWNHFINTQFTKHIMEIADSNYRKYLTILTCCCTEGILNPSGGWWYGGWPPRSTKYSLVDGGTGTPKWYTNITFCNIYGIVACKLKFRFRELISCFYCIPTSHTALEVDSRGSNGT